MYDMIIILVLLLVVFAVWLLIKYENVRCPVCGGRMKRTECTDTENIWTCQKCGHEIVVREDYDE